MRELVQQLAALPRPLDAHQAASRRRLLAALRGSPFDRRLAEHVTASAIVVGPRGVLLHRHKRLGTWLQPGGHVDAGEAPWEAARRETLEETGIVTDAGAPCLCHVDAHPAPCRPGAVHLDLRYLMHGDGEPRPAPGESRQAAWFGWESALALADPGLKEALRAALGRLRGAGPR